MSEEARTVLRFANEHASGIMKAVREKLPEGTDFGVMILVPGKGVGQVVALSTDREVVAPAVGQWVISVLGPDHESQSKGR